MASTLTGGCQCGFIRYCIHDEPRQLNVCHCTDCQQQSGSAFGMSLVIRPDAQYWTKSKQGWSSLISDIPSYETHE